MQEVLKKDRKVGAEAALHPSRDDTYARAVQETIQNYQIAREKTERVWAENQDIGTLIPPAYERDLALSSGSIITQSCYKRGDEHLLSSIEELSKFGIPLTSPLHFTLLAITTNRYALPSVFQNDQQDFIEALQNAFVHFTRGIDFTVEDLRLVPLPNALLLAGTPSREAFEARENLSHFIQESPLGAEHRKRYQGVLHIPPRFWHTTLLRSEHQFLPREIREIYFRLKEVSLGSLHLPPPTLTLCTFDWSTRHDVKDL